MGVILDLVASMAVRGAIVYIVLTMNISLNQLLYEKAQYAIVKQNTATVADILRNDFRALGYGVSGVTPFLIADTSRVKFIGDLDDNAIIDTVEYYLGPVSEMISTPNPDDRILYRKRNSGTPFDCGHGVTRLSLEYFDTNGSTTSTLSEIRALSIKIVMQGATQINVYYPTSIWETFLIPSNI
ncbi:MAG: hypothetical protein HY563_08580 [Ignavibacteriales bacterium]|nr:hypothetical protein [Ignavibacteriales bacterium]